MVKIEYVPIIFVPGIMGTRLKNQHNDKVWDPDAPMWMLWNFGLVTTTAADKKKMLIGDQFDADFVQPYEDDADHNEEFKLQNFDNAAARGWGAPRGAATAPS